MADSAESSIWPRRLHHQVPDWVKSGAGFHVRLRVDSTQPSLLMTEPIGFHLLAAADNYHRHFRWHCTLFLLMPDHLHAVLAFPADNRMATVIGDWKRFTARTVDIKWQKNFFDHRIRHAQELQQTWEYIQRNPVVKGLAASEADWRWKLQPMP